LLTRLRRTTNDENFGFPAGLGDQWVAGIFRKGVGWATGGAGLNDL
jgi:hypothetical protein